MSEYDKAARASKTTVLLAICVGGRDAVFDALEKYRRQGWVIRDLRMLRKAAAAELDRRMPIPEAKEPT